MQKMTKSPKLLEDTNMRKSMGEYQLSIGKIMTIVTNIVSILSWLGIPASIFMVYISQSKWWALLIVICVCVVTTIRIARANARYVVAFIMNLIAPSTPYKLKEWRVNYEYLSSEDMCFWAEYTVKAKQIGVNHIHVRYNWSGESKDHRVKPEPIKGSSFDTNRIEYVGKEYGYSYYKIFSDREHNKRDKPFKLGARIRMHKEKDQEISHHLLTSISMVTDVLIMRVILPPDIYPEQIRKVEFAHSSDFFHWHSEENVQAERDEKTNKWIIEWRVKPIYGGKYIIDWKPVNLLKKT